MGNPTFTAAAFIAADWGTSHLRLSLCGSDGQALETKNGPGVAGVKGRVAETFFEAVSSWDRALPVVFCGMVGSTIGWREVPYLACPIAAEKIAAGALRFEAEGRAIAIAPGLSCRNRLIGPDVMRGEETQILGALRSDARLARGKHVLCMPGTHSKWVMLQDGAIEHFLTGFAGELFDILNKHSVLVTEHGAAEPAGGPAFARALEQTRLHPDAELIHLLFETRSRQLAKDLRPSQASAYLSGLVIGQDVAGAVRLFRADLAQSDGITIVGTQRLSELYATALKARGIATRIIDGDAASLAGLAALHRELTGAAHAA